MLLIRQFLHFVYVRLIHADLGSEKISGRTKSSIFQCLESLQLDSSKTSQKKEKKIV
jgi:hypothetical protein